LGRPEFRLFEAQKQGFLFDSKQARANLLPQLSVNFQYGIDALKLSWSERGYASFVNLNIPIFDWFRSRSEQQVFQLRARQVEATRSAAARTFSREYESALARVRLVYEQIALTRSQVKLSEENLRLSRLRYEGGEGPALDVVAAQSQLAQARTNYYAAISGYLNARADLSVARGQ
jgi:outer membrane protein